MMVIGGVGPVALVVGGMATLTAKDAKSAERCGGWRSCRRRAAVLPHGFAPSVFFVVSVAQGLAA